MGEFSMEQLVIFALALALAVVPVVDGLDLQLSTQILLTQLQQSDLPEYSHTYSHTNVQLIYLSSSSSQSPLTNRNSFIKYVAPTSTASLEIAFVTERNRSAPCELVPPTLEGPNRNPEMDFNGTTWSVKAKISAWQPSYEPLLVIVSLKTLEASKGLNDSFGLLTRCINVDGLPRSSTTWIFISEAPATEDASNIIERTALASKLCPRLTDKIYVIQKGSVSSTARVYEVYGIKGHPFVRRLLEPEVEFLQTPTLSTRRNLDLIPEPLIVAHVDQTGILTRTGAETLTAVRESSGYLDVMTYEMFAYMQDFLSLQVQFHNVTHWVWSPGGEGVYSMADLVKEGKADLALSSTGHFLTVSFSFLFVTRVYKEVYIYYQESDEGSSPQSGNVFLGVFTDEALLGLLGMVVGVLLATPFFFSADLGEVALWAMALLTLKGSLQPPTKFEISSRLYLLAVALGCVLFYTILSGSLLVKFSFKSGLSSAADLAAHGYTFGVEDNGIIDNGFSDEKSGVWLPSSPVWPMKNLYTTFKSDVEGIVHAVDNPHVAYATLKNAFLDMGTRVTSAVVGRPGCARLRQMILVGDKRWGSAFVKSGSEFTDHFNYARLRMAETGLAHRTMVIVLRNEKETQPDCGSPTGSRFEDGHEHTHATSNDDNGQVRGRERLRLGDTSLLFYVLFTGILLALTILLYERKYGGVKLMECGHGHGSSHQDEITFTK